MTTTHRTRSRVTAWVLTILLTFGLLTHAAVDSVALPAPASPTVTVEGATALRFTWTKVTSATHYKVQYSTSTSFSSTTPSRVVTENKAIITGLKVGTTYYLRVSASDAAGSTSGHTWSAVKSAKTKYFYATAPTGLEVDNTSGTSIELHWTHVSGAPGYRVRAYSKENPTVYASTTNSAVTVTGLKKSTLYYIKLYVEQPPTGDLPALQQGPYSSEIQVRTSSYDLAAPSKVRVEKQAPTSIDLAWDAPDGMKSGYVYQVQYALNSSMSQSMKWYGTKTATPKLTISGLSDNTNYYMRVRVVDASGAQRSDRSDYVLAKTRVPLGTITGVVSGPPAGDVVVGAYSSDGELAEQVSVGSGGQYTFRVRPGSYRIHATYIGEGAYTSLWANSSTDGGRITSEATPVSVTTGGTTTAPTVRLTPGAVISGTIVDPSGKPVSAVDVTALTAHTSAREVAQLTQGDNAGKYSLKGLPDGQYWLRMIYSNDGFKNRSIWIDVKGRQLVAFRVSNQSTATPVSGVTQLNAKLDWADFRKTYGAWIDSDAKRVGMTVPAHATPWLAGSYPTTRATMTFQWKRNGVAIPGATGATYKITSTDKGKYLSFTATASRYGYKTGTVTTRQYKVS